MLVVAAFDDPDGDSTLSPILQVSVQSGPKAKPSRPPWVIAAIAASGVVVAGGSALAALFPPRCNEPEEPPENHPPRAVNDVYRVLQDGELRIGAPEGLLANDRDEDGDTLSVA